MDSSNLEVRLFLQHLAQWLGAFAQRDVRDCHSAIALLGERGRVFCADPEFKRLFLEAHTARGDNAPPNGADGASPGADGDEQIHMAGVPCCDPEVALGAMCSFLAAVTAAGAYSQYRSDR